jgi:predicted esterase
MVSTRPAIGGTVLSLLVLACGGTEGGNVTVSAATPCDDAANALCSKIEECAPFYMTITFADRAECVSRFKINGAGSFTANGTSAPDAPGQPRRRRGVRARRAVQEQALSRAAERDVRRLLRARDVRRELRARRRLRLRARVLREEVPGEGQAKRGLRPCRALPRHARMQRRHLRATPRGRGGVHLQGAARRRARDVRGRRRRRRAVQRRHGSEVHPARALPERRLHDRRPRAVQVTGAGARPLALLALLALACRRPVRDDPASSSPSAAPLSAASGGEAAPPADAAPAPDAAGPADAAPRPLPDVPTDWCLEGFRAIDEGTCYLLPDGVVPSRLLVYLAGIVPPTPRSPQKEKVQAVVAAAARRAGVAALLPRGRRGIGPEGARDWWAWPTGPADHAAHAATLLREWTTARTRLEAALGRPFARTYLAGSSSGAYFIAALALRGEVAFDGYAALSGGAPGGATVPREAGAPGRPPFYVGYATGDPTNGGPKALAARLSSGGWPVRVGVLAGGHGAREEYLDEALAFFAEHEADAGP